MIADFLISCMGSTATRTVPSLGASVSVASTNAGACSGTVVSVSAALRVTWSVMSPDTTNYETRVYMNGILQQTLANTATTWDYIVNGYIENGDAPHIGGNWVFRVDITRISDGVVVSTKTAPTWTQVYGHCKPF